MTLYETGDELSSNESIKQALLDGHKLESHGGIFYQYDEDGESLINFGTKRVDNPTWTWNVGSDLSDFHFKKYPMTVIELSDRSYSFYVALAGMSNGEKWRMAKWVNPNEYWGFSDGYLINYVNNSKVTLKNHHVNSNNWITFDIKRAELITAIRTLECKLSVLKSELSNC